MSKSSGRDKPTGFWYCSVCSKRMSLWRKLLFGLCSTKCVKTYSIMNHASQYTKQMEKRASRKWRWQR